MPDSVENTDLALSAGTCWLPVARSAACCQLERLLLPAGHCSRYEPADTSQWLQELLYDGRHLALNGLLSKEMWPQMNCRISTTLPIMHATRSRTLLPTCCRTPVFALQDTRLAPLQQYWIHLVTVLQPQLSREQHPTPAAVPGTMSPHQDSHNASNISGQQK